MKSAKALAAALLLGGLIAGCKTADMPTTAPSAPMAPTAMPTTSLPMATIPPAKDLTHVLTVDQPLFASDPSPTDTPGGTIKAGTKVLVLIPGATYSQVVTDTGISAYTATEGLKALGK